MIKVVAFDFVGVLVNEKDIELSLVEDKLERMFGPNLNDSDYLMEELIQQININIKYDGYIKRQQQQVKLFKKMESRRIPEDINYDDVLSLRLEARQKLKEFRPLNVGQASRISGVSPADISVLLVYLDSK